MANNNKTKFNMREFLSQPLYAPIALGKHVVTLGKCKCVLDSKEDGTDASYILVPMTFEDGRVVNNRFYNYGAKIAYDQLRAQRQDVQQYKNMQAFLNTLKDAVVDVWVEKRIYTNDVGVEKTTLQYSFTAPREILTAEDADNTEAEEVTSI